MMTAEKREERRKEEEREPEPQQQQQNEPATTFTRERFLINRRHIVTTRHLSCAAPERCCFAFSLFYLRKASLSMII
jgi:hypothetical protein